MNKKLWFLLLALISTNQLYAQTINIDQNWLNNQDSTNPIAGRKGPYYLDQASATYVLQTDVNADGSAFVMLADDIEFDLNGRTVTYNNDTPIVVPNGDFENCIGGVASGWSFANAPSAICYQGNWLLNHHYSGTHSLRLPAGQGNIYAQTNSLVTTKAKVPYALTAMITRKYAPVGTEVYVQLVKPDGTVAHEVMYTGNNNRGIQLVAFEFTDQISQSYYIRAGVRNGSGSDYVYIDNIKLVLDRTYGVAVGALTNDPEYRDITRNGIANRAVVKNGIVRDLQSALRGNAIYVRRSAEVLISAINGSTTGDNTSAVLWSAGEGIIENSVFQVDNRSAIFKRDAGTAVVHFFKGVFANNRIENGPHVGLNLDNGTSIVYGNTIKLKTKYTNAFAMIIRGIAEVYDNVVDSYQGEYAARGFMYGDSDGDVVVHDNIINIQLLANNQEYGGSSNQGAMLGGAYGFQLENGASNAKIYGNIITAYADQVDAYAFRPSSDSPQNNVHVHHNTFSAVKVSANNKHSAAIKPGYPGVASNLLEDNQLITNDMFVYGRSVVGFTLHRSTLTYNGSASNPILFGAETSDGSAIVDLSFIDSTFNDQNTRSKFENSIFAYIYPPANNPPNDYYSFLSAWSTTFSVRDSNGTPVSGALVTVNNNQNQQVFSGSTDSNGQVTGVIRQLRTAGDDKIDYNLHSVEASINGQYGYAQFTANTVQTVNLTLGSGGGASPSASASASPSASRSPSSSPSASPSASRSPSASPSASASPSSSPLASSSPSPSLSPSPSPSSPALPIVSVEDSEITEGDDGTKLLNFTVNLSQASQSTVTVDYNTEDESASAESDYLAINGTLEFAVGETSKTVSVTINGDTEVEADETFSLKLSNPVNAVFEDENELGELVATGTIINDDGGGDDRAGLTLSISDVTQLEGNGPRKWTKFKFFITPSRILGPLESVFVSYATADGTAKLRKDYKPKSGLAFLRAGQNRYRVIVKVKRDSSLEDEETFFVNLSNAVGAKISDGQGLGTILNDD